MPSNFFLLFILSDFPLPTGFSLLRTRCVTVAPKSSVIFSLGLFPVGRAFSTWRLCAGAEPGQQSTCFPATACTRVRRSGATCEESLQSTLAAVAKDICAGSTQSKQAGWIVPSHVNFCDKCPKMSDEGRLPHTLPPMALLCRGAGMGLGVV